MNTARLLIVAVALLTTTDRSSAAAPRIAFDQDTVSSVSAYLDVRLSLQRPAFLSLGVDSLGLKEWGENALRAPGPSSTPFQVRCQTNSVLSLEYSRSAKTAAGQAGWRIETSERSLRLLSRWSEAERPEPLVFEFDPHRCHVTLLGLFNDDGSIRLPALMHFPDQGSFRITAAGAQDLALGYDARRAGQAYIRVTFPPATLAHPRIDYRWEVAAIHPKLPAFEKDPRLNGFRRNWLNVLQLSPGLRVLANHAASDTCAFCLYEYADIARHSPSLVGDVTALDIIRQSLDRYLGGLAGYGLPGNVAFDTPGAETHHDPPYLDSYPSLLIASADYVAGSRDQAWLVKQYPRIKEWGVTLLAMDHDGNGLFEYPYSGNSGSWSGKADKRPSNWWDTIGFGHEDAYANALAYRALRGLEDLSARLHKTEDVPLWRAAADKLRAAYFDAFYNPVTGVLAGWRSADGQLHDYYFLFVNGIAIHYGLVPEAKANAIMDRLLEKMKAVGYTRFDLGLPGNLIPVARKDYAHLDPRWGGGKKEDNSDGFQIYENGGATASFAYFTLAALYDLGRREEADRLLFPMLDAFSKGAFQGQAANGRSNDWKAWDGTPWGYEGFLVDNYYALLAVLTRERLDLTAASRPAP
jgi:hypothetical protein